MTVGTRLARRALLHGTIALAASLAIAAVSSLSAEARPEAEPGLRVSGGSAAQRALVRQIVARMAPTQVAAVRIGPPPPNIGDWPRTVAYLTVTTRKGERTRAEWEAWLFAGAFHHLSRKRHLPTVFGFRSSGGGARLGVTGLRSPPPATAAAAAALPSAVSQAVRDTAGASGIRIVSLQVLQPAGLAFALVLRASDPAAYMRHHLSDLLEELGETRSELDGSFLALEDATGAVVWTSAQSARVGAGSNYTRSDLAGCNPIIHFGGFREPPPCPLVPIIESVLVCQVADTRLSTSSVSGNPFHICLTDRSEGPIAAQEPVYCTAHVLDGANHTLVVEVVREGTVMRTTTLAVTKSAWYQTAVVTAPTSGAWECRVRIAFGSAVTRSFAVG